MNITCPCCGRSTLDGFSRGEEHIISALANADEPLTAPEIMKGSSMDVLSFPSTLSKMKRKLESQGYRIANVGGHGNLAGRRARYRLEKLPETEAGKC